MRLQSSCAYHYSHIIANQFTNPPYSEVNRSYPARAAAIADQVVMGPGYSRLDHHHSPIDTASQHHEADSDLCTNDAYGGSMTDIGLVMIQDEMYTNEHSRSSHSNDGVALNECQTDSDSTNHGSGKVTVMMTDNAAYYINLSQVTDV